MVADAGTHLSEGSRPGPTSAKAVTARDLAGPWWASDVAVGPAPISGNYFLGRRRVRSRTPPASRAALPAAPRLLAGVLRRLQERPQAGEGMTVGAVITELDQDIRRAVANREAAISRWAHSPNADTHTAVQQAQAELDAKLEERFAAQ